MYRPPDTVRAIITDGKIDLPELGKVQAEGLSVAELQQLVEGRYAQIRKTKRLAPRIGITLI
jgi:protein involved in polysaccharide export with SLBB domain